VYILIANYIYNGPSHTLPEGKTVYTCHEQVTTHLEYIECELVYLLSSSEHTCPLSGESLYMPSSKYKEQACYVRVGVCA
jgi:hypothetical protein